MTTEEQNKIEDALRYLERRVERLEKPKPKPAPSLAEREFEEWMSRCPLTADHPCGNRYVIGDTSFTYNDAWMIWKAALETRNRKEKSE